MISVYVKVGLAMLGFQINNHNTLKNKISETIVRGYFLLTSQSKTV